MWRVGLIIYLALFVGAGPGFCQCLHPGDRDVSTPARFSETKKHCCQKPFASTRTWPVKHGDNPCQFKEARLVLPTLRLSHDDLQLREIGSLRNMNAELAAVLSTGANMANVAADTHPPPNLAFTNLEGREILRALHLLLC